MNWPWKLRLTREAEHLRTGRWGEKQARLALTAKGYRILGARVRVGRHDEIDLVARHDGVLVFVEVKTRKNEDFGRPIDAVKRDKRRKLSRAAVRYMKRLRRKPDYFRFDVVEVIGTEGAPPEIRHIENAFTLEAGYRVPW
jgi:putative endonuclease